MLLLFLMFMCYLSLTSQSIFDASEITNLSKSTYELTEKFKKPRTFSKKIGVSKEMEEASILSFFKEFDASPVTAYGAIMMTTYETLPASARIFSMFPEDQNGLSKGKHSVTVTDLRGWLISQVAPWHRVPLVAINPFHKLYSGQS